MNKFFFACRVTLGSKKKKKKGEANVKKKEKNKIPLRWFFSLQTRPVMFSLTFSLFHAAGGLLDPSSDVSRSEEGSHGGGSMATAAAASRGGA